MPGLPGLLVSFCEERRLPENIDLLLLGAGQIITCAGFGDGPWRGGSLSDPGIIQGGAIAVNGGRIFAIGTEEEVRSRIDGL